MREAIGFLEDMLAAAQALENLEAQKKAVKDGTSVLDQTVSQDAGVLSAHFIYGRM